MTYFDSLKNQAKWKTELAVLRREKELRKKSGYTPQKTEMQEEKNHKTVHRRPITLNDLIALEQKEKTVSRQNNIQRIRERRKEQQLGDERWKEKDIAANKGYGL